METEDKVLMAFAGILLMGAAVAPKLTAGFVRSMLLAGPSRPCQHPIMEVQKPIKTVRCLVCGTRLPKLPKGRKAN